MADTLENTANLADELLGIIASQGESLPEMLKAFMEFGSEHTDDWNEAKETVLQNIEDQITWKAVNDLLQKASDTATQLSGKEGNLTAEEIAPLQDTLRQLNTFLEESGGEASVPEERVAELSALVDNQDALRAALGTIREGMQEELAVLRKIIPKDEEMRGYMRIIDTFISAGADLSYAPAYANLGQEAQNKLRILLKEYELKENPEKFFNDIIESRSFDFPDRKEGDLKVAFAGLQTGILYPIQNRDNAEVSFLFIEKTNKGCILFTYKPDGHKPGFTLEITKDSPTADKEEVNKILASFIDKTDIFEPAAELSIRGKNSTKGPLPPYAAVAYRTGKAAINADQISLDDDLLAAIVTGGEGAEQLDADDLPEFPEQRRTKEHPSLILARDASGNLLAGVKPYPNAILREGRDANAALSREPFPDSNEADIHWIIFKEVGGKKGWYLVDYADTDPEKTHVTSDAGIKDYIDKFKTVSGVKLDTYEDKESLFDVMFSEEFMLPEATTVFTDKRVGYLKRSFIDQFPNAEKPPKKPIAEYIEGSTVGTANSPVHHVVSYTGGVKSEAYANKEAVATFAVAGATLLGALGIGTYALAHRSKKPATQNTAEAAENNAPSPESKPKEEHSWRKWLVPGTIAASAAGIVAAIALRNHHNNNGRS